MQNHNHNPPVSREALERKHESGEPSIGWILFVAGLVVLMLIFSELIVRWGMHGWAKTRPLDRTALARGIITTTNLEMLQRFPGPNLEIDPHNDLVALRARNEAELNSYGWVDRTNGIVRIPIERAMDLLAQRGLPVRPTHAPAATGKSSLELIRERSQQR